jgi:exosortase E/protease (VPEID-CTERM system)
LVFPRLSSNLTPTLRAGPLGSASAPLRLPSRLAILGALFAVELLLISIWLDAEVLRGRGMLASLVHDWGAWLVRLGVAIALGSLIFAESRAKSKFRRISDQCAIHGIHWPLLAAHAAGMTLFLWLSSLLFHQSESPTVSAAANTLVFFWGLTGIVALALAACALIAVPVWIDLFRSTGDAWVYGLSAALVSTALGAFAQRLWVPLSHWTLSLVVVMVRPLVAALVVDPSTMTIGTPAFYVTIAPECSGYEGIGLILAFSSAWLWFFRRQWRFPQALLLIPAGVAVIWLANAVRIAALLLIGIAGAPGIAAGGFHSQAGWIAFNIVAIGFCLIARRIPALTLPTSTVEDEAEIQPLPSETTNPTVPYLLPFLAILAAAMVSRSMSASFEWLYPLRVAAAGGALWYFRGRYRNIDWKFSWIGVAAGALVFAIWIALEPAGHTGAPAALLQASGAARIAWITLRVFGAVVMVPIAEELAFRGFLLRRLASSDFESVDWRAFSWMPFLISSAAFGLLHGERWLAGTIAGAVFALAQLRRGRIGEAIAAHAVANALVAAWVLIAGNWRLW